jgi:hypothetical protein
VTTRKTAPQRLKAGRYKCRSGELADGYAVVSSG